jgi:hypothetical protein
VTPVNLDVDETSTHYLIFVSPRVEAQSLGIGYHRSRLPKCGCWRFSGQGRRCLFCRGWSAETMALHVRALLRSYPKIKLRVTSALVDTPRGERWQVMASVPAAAVKAAA